MLNFSKTAWHKLIISKGNFKRQSEGKRLLRSRRASITGRNVLPIRTWFVIIGNNWRHEVFVFGHIGITLGTAVLIGGIQQTIVSPKLMNEAKVPSECSSSTSLATISPVHCRASGLSSLGKYIDIRFLLI